MLILGARFLCSRVNMARLHQCSLATQEQECFRL